jgi:hypothetical protein
MSREAFEQGDWPAVIAAHPLESHDPQEWLRYGIALLQTIQPGPDVGKQQQQAALALLQAQKEGATPAAVAVAQKQAALLSMAEAFRLAGVESAVIEEACASLAQSGSLLEPQQPVSNTQAQRRLMMLIAGFFNLDLPLALDYQAQVDAARGQLQAAQIGPEEVERCLLLAAKSQPNLNNAEVNHLIALLRA